MAGQPSNFDAEIKKGMQPKAAKTSTNAAPDKAPAKGGNFNAKPKPSPAQPNDISAQPSAPPAVNTHQAMLDAGQAHMAAIHAHINSMKGGA